MDGGTPNFCGANFWDSPQEKQVFFYSFFVTPCKNAQKVPHKMLGVRMSILSTKLPYCTLVATRVAYSIVVQLVASSYSSSQLVVLHSYNQQLISSVTSIAAGQKSQKAPSWYVLQIQLVSKESNFSVLFLWLKTFCRREDETMDPEVTLDFLSCTGSL